MRCREDVLRAKDIMPPFRTSGTSDQNLTGNFNSENDESRAESFENIISQTKEALIDNINITSEEQQMLLGGQIPKKIKKTHQLIPKFNLADKILVEQRKVSSVRRTRSVQSDSAKQVPLKADISAIDDTHPAPSMPQSPHHRIIAEIVARDIEQLSLLVNQIEKTG